MRYVCTSGKNRSWDQIHFFDENHLNLSKIETFSKEKGRRWEKGGYLRLTYAFPQFSIFLHFS